MDLYFLYLGKIDEVIWLYFLIFQIAMQANLSLVKPIYNFKLTRCMVYLGFYLPF